MKPKQVIQRARRVLTARHDGGTVTAASSWYRIENTGPGQPAHVWIYQEIGWWGVTAEQFVTDLQAIAAAEIHVHINSPGGEVFDGLAIYNALRSHPAQVTVLVEGLAASAASFIAMAGNEVQIARAGYLMIHDALTFAYGNPAELRELADFLDKISDSIADIYAQRAIGRTQQEWRALMQAETWFTGLEAVEAGLADGLLAVDTPAGQTADVACADCGCGTDCSCCTTDECGCGPDCSCGPDDGCRKRPGNAWLRQLVALTQTGTVPAGVATIAPTRPVAAVETTTEPEPEPDPEPPAADVPEEPPTGPPATPAGPTDPTETAADPDAEWADLTACLTTQPTPTVDDLLASLREA